MLFGKSSFRVTETGNHLVLPYDKELLMLFNAVTSKEVAVIICPKVSSTETFVAGWGADTSGYSR